MKLFKHFKFICVNKCDNRINSSFILYVPYKEVTASIPIISLWNLSLKINGSNNL